MGSATWRAQVARHGKAPAPVGAAAHGNRDGEELHHGPPLIGPKTTGRG
ncbi:hypothetical protein [Azospirillum palustre]